MTTSQVRPITVATIAGVCAALIFLPQFAGNGYVFLGLLVLAGIWSATGLRSRLSSGEAGPNYAVTKGL